MNFDPSTQTLIFASANPGKIEEYKELFLGSPFELKSLLDFEDIPEIREVGQSFSDNAFIKARTVSEYFGIPTFAEDSGLEVYALYGEPGVFSRRYAGESATDLDNIEKLLAKLAEVALDQRLARFRAVICLSLPVLAPHEFEEIYFEGECEGLITTECRGTNGFGYDPVFWVSEMGKTFAEMEIGEKNLISHRKKAAAQLLTYLEDQYPLSVRTQN
jgi:XTP/dITP diphosphohydrolase